MGGRDKGREGKGRSSRSSFEDFFVAKGGIQGKALTGPKVWAGEKVPRAWGGNTVSENQIA